MRDRAHGERRERVAPPALTDTIHGYVPLRLDVGLRLFDRFYVGALVQHAAILPDACDGDLSCTGSDTRIGVLTASF